MTKSEALNTLMKMRAWRRWGKGEQNEKDRPEMPEQKEVDEAFDVCIEMLSKSSLPSNLDEAAREFAKTTFTRPLSDTPEQELIIIEPDKLAGFKAGAEWMAGQGSSREVEVKEDAGGYPYIPSIELYDYDKNEPLSKSGDKVVVQIRKK